MEHMLHNELLQILVQVHLRLLSTSARNVADVLQRHVFDYVNKLIEEVATTWLGQVQIVRVSGHPQS